MDVKIAVLALAAGGACILGVGALKAHAHPGFRFHGDHAMVHRFVDFAVNEKLDEIQATDEQKAKVREIKDRLMKDGQALREGHAGLHEQMLALLAQDNPDPAQVKALVRQRTDALVRFGDEAADALVELHGVLTPAQRQKLLADAREHRAGHDH